MIALALLMTVASADTNAPATAGSADIVVTAAKLRKIRISANTDDKGRVTACQVTVSSGDATLDRLACEATRDCAAAGVGSGEAVGDCVDQRLIAFAGPRAQRHESGNGNDAANR